MGEDITLVMSAGDVVLLILGLVGTYVTGALIGMRRQLSQLYCVHLGDDARDGDNHLKWYTPSGLVQSIDENSAETQQLGDHIMELTRAIKEESRCIRETHGGRAD